MANLLVTGGAGFIGTNFVIKHLAHHPHDLVVVLDALTYAGNLENLTCALGEWSVGIFTAKDVDSIRNLAAKGKGAEHSADEQQNVASADETQQKLEADNAAVQADENTEGAYKFEDVIDTAHVIFVQGDINDCALVRAILEHCQIDSVVHFAAESHVDRSIYGPDIFLQTNVQGTYNLINTVYHYQLDTGRYVKFHHVSTDEVYGALDLYDKPFTESSPLKPNSPYSASKAASDCLVRPFAKTYGMHVTISNCSNNYGPYQHSEKLIPKTIEYLLAGKRVPIYGSGKQVRDWISVSDHCLGIELCLRHGKSGHTYNLGAGCEVSNIEMVEMIGRCIHDLFADNDEYEEIYPNCLLAKEKMAINDKFIEHIEDRLGHDFRYAINYKKAELYLGFRPRVKNERDLYESLRETVKWYLDRKIDNK